ncbi:YeeE/YedE thiosulfate transporter family protein [soil metagenome]
MLEMGLRTFANPLLGGALVGLAAAILLLFNGRVAGVSGILNRTFVDPWRSFFTLGLIVGGAAIYYLGGAWGTADFSDGTGIGLGQTVVAGLFVGFGTVLGSGCTSGHGVCGISRFSVRSIAATLIFIFAGFVTVTVLMNVIR